MKNYKKLKEKLVLGIVCCSVLIVTVMSHYKFSDTYSYENNSNISVLGNNVLKAQDGFVYLSDIPYQTGQVGWGNLLMDKTSADTKIQVRVEGAAYSFDKGIFAHASSTIIYNLADYKDYAYFTSYIGLNTTSTKGNGVTFFLYTSTDGTNWDLKKEVAKLPGSNADYVKIDIRDANYLKLVANDNGANGQDHSVYADAKLIKDTYQETPVESLAEIDAKIKALGTIDLNNADHELLILQRALVKNAGGYALTRFIQESEANKAAFEWLYYNLENLRLYTMGGAPAGSYYNSLNVLSELLAAHKSDFDNNALTKYGNRYGDLYKRMAISLSLTHSTLVGLWMQPSSPENISNAVTRYEIYKELHKNDKFVVNSSIDITEWFENYNIEEMRFVMNNLIDDEEILWLNEYIQSNIDAHPNQVWTYLTPHPYMAYVWPNYSNPVFHDATKKDYWDEKFNGIFSKYNVTYRSGLYKVWMNFRNEFGTGAVCGGISKTGSNIRATHGIPATVIGQPGHAAILYYTQDAQGRGYWNIDNDVSGWTLSEKGERMLLGWGNATWSRGYSVLYMALAQEVLNDHETYEESQKYVLLAETYSDNLEMQETMYRKALEIQSLNINAWYGLITVYNANENKSEDQYYELAKEIGENLKYFPLPMYHLTNLIKPKLTSIENSYKFTLLQTRILTEGSVTPNNTADIYYVYQPSLTRLEANYLLGKIDKTIATFSFDGEDAGKIVLSDRFNGNGVRWDYSLDGGNTWKEVSFTAEEEHKLQLTADEIAQITEDNDIKIHIVGVNYNEENIYKIDITKAALSTLLFNNDLENRVVGIDTTYEWRFNENDPWTSYLASSPNLTGDKTIQVRVGANGTKLPSDIVTYQFTKDNQPNTRKYIPVSHLSIEAVSTQATNNQGSATYSIDANYNTRYHSAWNGTDTERYVVIKLDNPVLLSAVEFVPAGGGNGKIYDGTIYGSMDGENWEILSQKTGLTYTNQANTIADAIANTKSFDIDTPKEVQYVKIVADRSNGNWFAARAFNLYQDITNNPAPTAGIAFDKTELTNQDVIARLVNPSTSITITNNNGSDTYVFTKNGEFTFEFVDENGFKGTAKAKVDWIDKEAPTATIEYSIDTKTSQEVVATLIPSEEVTVLNNGSFDENLPNSNPFTYTFMENGEFTFEFKDKAGNIGTATARVDWIDENLPEVFFTYSTTTPTKNEVTVTISFDKENIVIINNDGSNTYTFKENGEFVFMYQDELGNVGSAKAKVDWIITEPDEPEKPNPDEDNKPDEPENPGEDNKPGEPENPDEDNKPGVPENPDEDNDDSDVKFGGSVNISSPSYDHNSNNNSNNNNNSSSSNNSNTSKPNTNPSGTENPDTSNPEEETDEPEFEVYETDKVTLKTPSNISDEKVVLKSDSLVIPKEIKDKVTTSSEYFEVYFEEEETKQKTLVKPSVMTMRIKTDATKKLEALYEVTENNQLIKLNYQKLGNNQVEVNVNSLGKYLVTYTDEKKEEQPIIKDDVQKEEDKSDVEKESNHNVIWFLGSAVMLVILAVVIFIRRK